ncbi:MAG: sigma-70 family RNA polymerase sigma factor [Planctomycetota bacterium]
MREGDRRSLEVLVVRHQRELLNRIRWLMGPKARAEAETRDFLQQVLVEALDNAQRMPRTELQIVAWLTHLARNNIVDATRRKREMAFDVFSEEALAASGERPDRELVQEELRERVLKAITALPVHYQTVVELRHLERLPFAAIAERMGKTKDAVEKLHARALVRLGGLIRGARAGDEAI